MAVGQLGVGDLALFERVDSSAWHIEQIPGRPRSPRPSRPPRRCRAQGRRSAPPETTRRADRIPIRRLPHLKLLPGGRLHAQRHPRDRGWAATKANRTLPSGPRSSRRRERRTSFPRAAGVWSLDRCRGWEVAVGSLFLTSGGIVRAGEHHAVITRPLPDEEDHPAEKSSTKRLVIVRALRVASWPPAKSLSDSLHPVVSMISFPAFTETIMSGKSPLRRPTNAGRPNPTYGLTVAPECFQACSIVEMLIVFDRLRT
jgi:hypothetical protein